MQWLVVIVVTSLGCSANRRPVSKRLTALAEVQPTASTAIAPEAPGPWHHRQGRWAGRAIATAPTIQWAVPTQGPVVHPIRFDGERVFAVAGGEVLALTPSVEVLGRVMVDADGPVGFGDAGVFVPTRSGTVLVLDPSNGTRMESHSGRHPIKTVPLPLGPAVAWVDGTGGLMTTSGPFGQLLEGPISDAATHDSILVLGNAKGDVVATSTTGTRWQTRAPGPVLHHPVLDGDRAYIAYGTHDARHAGLRALDLATGDVIWETRLRFRPSGPPALGPHVIIADSNAEVLALDLNHGGIRWRAPTPSTVAGQPTIQSDAIYISRHDGHIDRMDMADGGTVWSLDVGGAATGQMCQTDSGIVLGTADGRIIGLGAR